MLCILCMNYPNEFIDIFGDDGIKLDAVNVITKHFWIQPTENDENKTTICKECWSALSAFHSFYIQVEKAHLSLISKAKSTEDDLKLEENIAVHCVGETEKYEPFTEYINAEVKLEIKEDGEVPVVEENPTSGVQVIENVTKLSSLQDDSCDSSDSDDPEFEIPLADLRKQGQTTSFNSEEVDLSTEWQCNDSNDDDSDSEPKEKTVKDVPPSKTGKKRGRPCKNLPRDSIPKQTTEEQLKKRELSQEYDEIIAKNMKLSCSICLLPLANFFILKKHYRTKHNERGYATCCGKKFLKRGILVDHIYTHLNPEHFKCDKCEKVLADRRCLEVHMSIHMTEKQRIYQCDQCCKSFFKKPLLTRHLHIHIPEEERKFRCEECNKYFPSNYTLRAHINNVHQNAYAKICDQCGKKIRGREAFQRHLLEHAGIPIPSVQCDKCGAKLKNKYGLKRHMNSMHAESNVPHVCNMCGKIAPNSAALQRHYSYVHKCERTHKCPMCDKAFKKAGGLKEHMSTHTGEVLYTCPHCPKTFNSNANMHSHRKKMHRKEWEENRRHPHMGAAPQADRIGQVI